MDAIPGLIRSRPALAPAAAAGGWTKRLAAPETMLPRDTAALNLVPGAAAWQWGAWGVLSAATPADFYPHAVHAQYPVQSYIVGLFQIQIEVEVATGPAGSEVFYGAFSHSMEGAGLVAGCNPFMETGLTHLFGTTMIPAGTRVVARVRSSQALATVGGGAVIYLAGYDGSVPASDTTYPLDDFLAGVGNPQTLVTPAGGTLGVLGAAWGSYGAPVVIHAAAPQDLLVQGTTWLGLMAGPNRSRYLQFLIGPAGSEVPYSTIGLPGRSYFGVATHRLARPLLVLAGERLTVATMGQADVSQHQFLETLL